MIVETRKTSQGTEYWDNKEKRVLFVPKGKVPSFKVTENPKSMIGGVDLAIGKDRTVITTSTGPAITRSTNEDTQPPLLMNGIEDMDVEQLLDFAERQNINVPGNMKKEDTIRNYIQEELNAAVDASDTK
ncbi:hypothetical protein [Alkalihalobacillus sp. 1P02AB]|uniref:hypothetical protein n=1 Tax=Alkalihalobacillus sp. 1P02AB TaxID=3132260 RepID=UPI0039A640B6